MTVLFNPKMSPAIADSQHVAGSGWMIKAAIAAVVIIPISVVFLIVCLLVGLVGVQAGSTLRLIGLLLNWIVHYKTGLAHYKGSASSASLMPHSLQESHSKSSGVASSSASSLPKCSTSLRCSSS